MGTKVQVDSYMPRHPSMRDLDRESNGESWPPYYVDNNFPDGQCHGFLPRTTLDSHSGYDSDIVKQTMLEHDAVFKNQVFELHRLYQVQRDLVDEVRRKEQITRRLPHETSSSSSHVPSHTFPLANSVVDRSIVGSGTGTIQSSPSSIKGKSAQVSPSSFPNCCSPKNSKVSESRPTKCRRKMLDLQLPADEYLDPDDVEQFGDTKVSDNITPLFDKNRFLCENRKPVLNYPGKTECQGDSLRCDSHVSKSMALVDLNEPLHVEETTVVSSVSASSQLMRSLLDQLTQPPAFITRDRIKGDTWREKPRGNQEKYDESYSLPSYNMPLPILSSHVPNQSSLFHPSGDQCSSSRNKPSGFSSEKFSVLTSPCLDSTAPSKSPQSSAQSNDFFGNKWNLNSTAGASAAYGGESSGRNRFYQGSSCSFKELPGVFPPVNFDYVNPTTGINVGPVKDMNLNAPYSNEVSNDKTDQPDFKVVDNNNKSKDPRAKNGHPFAMSSYYGNVKSKKPESSDCPSSRKILGVPIFEKPPTPKKEEVERRWRKGGFDMNLPCDPSDSELDTLNVEVVTSCVRNHFDLNSCVTEEESPCGATSLKGDTGIDLEVPVMVESDEDVHPEKIHLTMEREEKHPELLPDQADNGEAELAKSAAETIVAISFSVNQNQSLTEASEEDMLRWFVDIACTSGNDHESHIILDQNDDNGDWARNCLPEGLDDYESMILRLKECTMEEYFPKPSIPEFPNMEENVPCLLTTRTRKGHACRGRQRRDFQRDILPGLTSLSRYEVTEDLQTFGGLMRATGHPWHSTPNRRNATRNGCGRGRRRSVVVASPPTNAATYATSKPISCSNTETVLGDRCLTGWGKTTRRPRRQRCPPGNPPLPLPLR